MGKTTKKAITKAKPKPKKRLDISDDEGFIVDPKHLEGPNDFIDFNSVKDRARPVLLAVLEHWYPDGRVDGREFAIGDAEGNEGASLKFNIDKGVGSDFAAIGDCWQSGDIISLNAARLKFALGRDVSLAEAARDLTHLLDKWGTEPPKPGERVSQPDAYKPISPVAKEQELTAQGWTSFLSRAYVRKLSPERPTYIWEYRTASGALLQYVLRWDTPESNGKRHKEIRPLTLDSEKMDWTFKHLPAPRPLYGLDRLATRHEDPVLLVEGEKTADAAGRMFPDHVAVTWCGGAKNVHRADWNPLKGRNVILWPDADQPGVDAMADVADCLRAVAATVRVVKLPEGLLEWDLADEVPEGMDVRALIDGARHAESHSESGTPAGAGSMPATTSQTSFSGDLDEDLERMNQTHFVSKEAGRVRVYSIEEDFIFDQNRFKLENSSFQDIQNLYLNRQYPTEKRTVSLGHAWVRWEGRCTYRGIVFDPKRQPGALREGYFNLWRGFRVEPKPGCWGRFREHIFDNICQKDQQSFDYLMNWLARTYQRPSEPGEVAVVLGGPQGAGKGCFARNVGYPFGQHFIHISNEHHLSGKFNAHQRDAILLFADESFWAGSHQGKSALKRLITEPTLMIEAKAKDAIMVPNMIHLIMVSNDKWIVPADWDARRFFVLKVSGKVANNREWFSQIEQEMTNGGHAALLHDMLSRNISGFNPQHFPQTEALREQKLQTMVTHDSWWLRKLESGQLIDSVEGRKGGSGEWGTGTVTCKTDDLHNDYLDEAKRQQNRYPLAIQVFGQVLKDFFEQWKDNPENLDRSKEWPVKKRDSRANLNFYILPKLGDCRRAFELYTKTTWKWPEEGDEPM